jgi:hypothetical protein
MNEQEKKLKTAHSCGFVAGMHYLGGKTVEEAKEAFTKGEKQANEQQIPVLKKKQAHLEAMHAGILESKKA